MAEHGHHSSAFSEFSFLLTAAGQLRSLTGFPFQMNLVRFITGSRIDYIVSLIVGQPQDIGVGVEM